eukprot:Pompholyxophrys_sp_v1_NODE_3_length_18401_cov_4.332280.p3 type:complete len:488 gc:universal NODE_3_length_18401_cov_4.332280:1902-439(-)
MSNFYVFIPIRHESQRVPGKNYRMLGDKPLYCHMIDTLLNMSEITGILVDTNSPIVKDGCVTAYGHSNKLRIIDRNPALCSADVSMNILIDNFLKTQCNSDSKDDDNIYIQTHVTNPFLSADTIRSALNTFMDVRDIHDSLLTVNVIQSRLYDEQFKPINHKKGVLCQTQDLPKIYEDNSCLYLFTKKSFYKNNDRIGSNPYYLPMHSKEETVDIDWEEDFLMAKMYLALREERKSAQSRKVVLITGVSGGIGNETARKFQKENWYVIGTDIVENRLDSYSKPYDRFIQTDLTDKDAAKALYTEIYHNEGKLDALINVAAIQDCSTYEEMSIDKWDQIMTCNLKTPYFLAQAMAPLLERNKGSIVNVSSVHALQTSDKISCYAISKAGMSGLTRNLAIELGKLGIRVNSVCPGAVDTPMLRAGLSRNDAHTIDDSLSMLNRKHILGRIGQPADIASCIYFLASEDAGFITGSNMIVDGGATVRLSTE